MRALPVSAVLTSIALSGWLTGAAAQDVGATAWPGLNSTPFAQSGMSGNLSSGFMTQPGLDSPGLLTGVTLGQLYTDNLRLAAGSRPKQPGWITQVQPFIKGATASPRFTGLFDYSLSGFLYEQPSGRHQLAQNLDARGTLTLLPQHFFVDGTAMYGREIINNSLPYGYGDFFLDNNRANAAIGTLSPYWMQDLGRAGIMTLRYTYGRVTYNARGIPGENRDLLNGIPDVTSNAVQLNLASPKNQTWGWDASYSEQHLVPGFGPHWDFAVAKVGVSYQLNNYLQLLADGGTENKFLPDGTMQKLDAPFWDAGFQWTNSRDNFKLMAGHRFFGHSYQLSWTHEAALLTTNVSYVEQPTTYNQQLLGMNFGGGGLPPINVHPEIPSLLERQPYLMKRLAASAEYTMPRSRLRVQLYDESRTYFTEQDTQERVMSANVAWAFTVGPYTTLTPSVQWQRYRFRSGQTNDARYGELALIHELSVKDFGSVRLRHEQTGVASASQGAHGYTANVLFVQWTHLF